MEPLPPGIPPVTNPTNITTSWATPTLESFSQGWIPAGVQSCLDTLQSHLPEDNFLRAELQLHIPRVFVLFHIPKNFSNCSTFLEEKQKNQLQIYNLLNELP